MGPSNSRSISYWFWKLILWKNHEIFLSNFFRPISVVGHASHYWNWLIFPLFVDHSNSYCDVIFLSLNPLKSNLVMRLKNYRRGIPDELLGWHRFGGVRKWKWHCQFEWGSFPSPFPPLILFSCTLLFSSLSCYS